MGYDLKKWVNRMKSRTDLSAYTYHLTKSELNEKGEVTMESLDRLLKIIKEKKLIGSNTQSGFITGNRKAVCFQDAPISGITQNIMHEQDFREDLGGKVRYLAFGLAFSKVYIFQEGGRPVLYEKKEIAKEILPRNEWWRIVNFDLDDEDNLIDWTHEREWRLPLDEFHFDLSFAIVILPNEHMYRKFIEKVPSEDLKSIKGIIQAGAVIY